MKVLARHIRIVQSLLKSQQPLSSEDIYWDLFGYDDGEVPRRTIQRDLKKLVEVGLLDRSGKARSTSYQVSQRAYIELVEIFMAYRRERAEFQKYKPTGIAPRFTFGNRQAAVGWLIRRTFLSAHSQRLLESRDVVRPPLRLNKANI